MPIRSGLIVVLRLFAILLLLQIAGYMLAVAATMPGSEDASRLPQIAMASLLLIPFLLIFWGSAEIIDFLTPKFTETVPEGPVNEAGLQAIAFSAIGAFIVFLALGESVGLLAAWHYVRQTPGTESLFPFADLPKALLGWIVGIYLLLGGPGLRQWIIGLRRAGTNDV
jgi:ABC-type sulfate transport system permease component